MLEPPRDGLSASIDTSSFLGGVEGRADGVVDPNANGAASGAGLDAGAPKLNPVFGASGVDVTTEPEPKLNGLEASGAGLARDVSEPKANGFGASGAGLARAAAEPKANGLGASGAVEAAVLDEEAPAPKLNENPPEDGAVAAGTAGGGTAGVVEPKENPAFGASG
jgi:hypothetical protein